MRELRLTKLVSEFSVINQGSYNCLLAYREALMLGYGSLDNLQSYCQSNKIRVNVKKTKCMVFNRGGKLLRGSKFHFGEEELELVNRFDYLGFLLTPSISIKDILSDLYKRGLKAYVKMK